MDDVMNLYPVKTIIGGKIIRNCRLTTDDGGTTLWRWDKESGAAVELLRVTTQPTRIGATQNWQIEDLVIEPQRGCGCSHPMYTFVPPTESLA